MLLDIDGIVRYSDELMRVHHGEVIDNADPKKIGRIKVKIEFLYDGAKADLPWVYPNQDSPNNMDIPEVGEKVKIIFRNGDIYHPEYIGYYHSTAKHNPTFDADYPDTIGINRQGFKAIYNKKAETLEISCPNGSFMKMTKDGTTTFNCTKDFKVTATADVGFTADGKVDVKATGNLTLTSDGEAMFAGKGKTTVGDAGSQTFVNGTQVLIAGGGSAVAMVGGQSIGVGNLGAPVLSTIISGSSKAFVAS